MELAPLRSAIGMMEKWNDGILVSGIMEKWVIREIHLQRKAKDNNKCISFS
jgi:hypothetical protein